MAEPNQHVLVYDVGGSHISAAVCDAQTYALSGLSRAPLPAETSSSITASSFGRLIYTLGQTATKSAGLEDKQIGGAALAMPGPFDYQNGISQMRHKLVALYGIDLKGALAGRFHWEPSQVRFVNDAAAFLLGEVGAGAAKGFKRAVGITLGTGIGCAFSSDGRIAVPSDAPGGNPGVPPGGEIWNLPYNGATVEDFVSTRFLRSRYQALTGIEADVSAVAAIALCKDDKPCVALDEALLKQASDVENSTVVPTEGHTGSAVPAATPSAIKSIPVSAASKAARQAFEDFGRHLALALNQHASAFAPEVIVLGGGISRASSLFLPATRKALDFPTTLAISTLMDEAPLAGAGVHWFAEG